jgi:hypothetical protein
LQLLPHRHLVLGPTAHHAARRGVEAEQRLHVMADLVRDDVSLREVARGAEAPIELVVEAEVDVDALVSRAIERADLGA